ncbi:MAG: DUF3631 domain-containing protein [Candidatus Nanopelagicales bacterium]
MSGRVGDQDSDAPASSSYEGESGATSTNVPSDRELHGILADLEDFVNGHAVLPSPYAAKAIALWIVHSHTIDRFDSTARLAVSSAEKGSGKTRLLEILETTVKDPLRAADVSAATLYRAIEKRAPTLLLDEYDVIFRSSADSGDAVRGIVNAGYRRGNPVLRCVGKAFEVEPFETFAAVALAGNGDPPETILDRSVVVRIRKRKPSETVRRWRVATSVPEGHALRDRVAEWASRPWKPVFPDDEPGIADRLLDVWEPLLAIADAAGGDWPEEAREAVSVLTETLEVETIPIRLLREIRETWPHGKEWVSSRDLLLQLHAIEDGPWTPGGPYGERGLTPHRLARILHPYRVTPSHNAANTARGYLRFAFADAWDRYLPSVPPTPSQEASEPSQPSEPSPETTLREAFGTGGSS